MKASKWSHAEKSDVTYKLGVNLLKIYINGILHFFLRTEHFISLQSWYSTKNDCKIEIYTAEKTIILEYNSVEKWKAVLDILDTQL